MKNIKLRAKINHENVWRKNNFLFQRSGCEEEKTKMKSYCIFLNTVYFWLRSIERKIKPFMRDGENWKIEVKPNTPK